MALEDRLVRFRKGVSPEASPRNAAGERTTYEAYRVTSHERRYVDLRRRFPKPSNAISYGMLTYIDGECRMGLGVTLTFGVNTILVDITGERLTELYRALLEWKVDFIQEFDAVVHLEPADPAAPLVKSITIHTTRPEDPPSANHRH